MKLGFLSIFSILLFNHSIYSQNKNLDIDALDAKLRASVYDMSYKSFSFCDSSDYPDVNSKNSTDYFLKRFQPESLKKGCEWYLSRFGTIEKIELKAVLESKNGNKIFRYKVKREFSDFVNEIRTTVNKQGKFAGIISKPYWSDKFYKWNENPKLKEVDTAEISKNILKVNKEFAFKGYNKCDKSIFNDDYLKNIPSKELAKIWKKHLKPECDSIKKINGNFKKIILVQVLSDSLSTKIYRYKVKFDNLTTVSEIRLYNYITDKHMGLFVLNKWFDKYKPFKEALKN